MSNYAPPPDAPLANAHRRDRLARRNKAAAARALADQERLEALAAELAKEEVARQRREATAPRPQPATATSRPVPKMAPKPASPDQPAPFVGPVGAPSPLMAYTGGVGIRGVRFVEPWVETQGRASLRPFHREKRRYQGHGYGSPARAAYRP